MTVSSRTPDGLPYRCPVCGKKSAQWPCLPEGAAICPHCGSMIWFSWLQSYICRVTGADPNNISPESTLAELGMDSLDFVEMVMELENEYGFTIPDEQAERIRSIDDLIRFLDEYFGRRGKGNET